MTSLVNSDKVPITLLLSPFLPIVWITTYDRGNSYMKRDVEPDQWFYFSKTEEHFIK